jgi:hypothetical protein
MRTNVVLDESLVEEAKALTGIKTTRAVIDEALRLLIQRREPYPVRELRGPVPREDDQAVLREAPTAIYEVSSTEPVLHLIIEPQLYSRVEQAASQYQVGVDRIFTDAVRRYLWELDRRRISEESQLYQRCYAELKTQYPGQYIAMHGGQVVDHDPDVTVLRERIRQRFGRRPVMITLVEEVAERSLVRRGFQAEAPAR